MITGSTVGRFILLMTYDNGKYTTKTRTTHVYDASRHSKHHAQWGMQHRCWALGVFFKEQCKTTVLWRVSLKYLACENTCFLLLNFFLFFCHSPGFYGELTSFLKIPHSKPCANALDNKHMKADALTFEVYTYTLIPKLKQRYLTLTRSSKLLQHCSIVVCSWFKFNVWSIKAIPNWFYVSRIRLGLFFFGKLKKM